MLISFKLVEEYSFLNNQYQTTERFTRLTKLNFFPVSLDIKFKVFINPDENNKQNGMIWYLKCWLVSNWSKSVVFRTISSKKIPYLPNFTVTSLYQLHRTDPKRFLKSNGKCCGIQRYTCIATVYSAVTSCLAAGVKGLLDWKKLNFFLFPWI